MQKIKCTFLSKKTIKNGSASVCIMECTIELPVEFPMNIEIRKWLKRQAVKVEFMGYNFNFTVVGKALKHHKDTDSVVGERLAEARAKRKAYKLCYNLLNEIYKSYKKKIDTLRFNEENFGKLYYRESAHIHELIASTNFKPNE